MGLDGVHVEWDADACATLRAAGFADVVEADVRAVDYEALGRFDLVWASPPCQPFSSAGKRQGATDERDGWPWTLDVLDRVRPRWFVAENVVGMTTHAAGHGERCPACYLERMLVGLRALFPFVQATVLDAADFGVPQRRRRLILVCGPVLVPWPKATHARTPDLFGRRRWRSLGEALGLDGERAIGGGYNPPAGRPDLRTERDLIDEPSTTIPAMPGGNALFYIQQMEGAPRHADHAAPAVGTKGNMLLLRPSPAVSAVGEEKGSGAGGNPEKLQRASDALFLAVERRRLTVEECAKLQAFPDGWPFQGTKSSRYRQVGNACPAPMVEAVIRQVLAADARLRGGP